MTYSKSSELYLFLGRIYYMLEDCDIEIYKPRKLYSSKAVHLGGILAYILFCLLLLNFILFDSPRIFISKIDDDVKV